MPLFDIRDNGIACRSGADIGTKFSSNHSPISFQGDSLLIDLHQFWHTNQHNQSLRFLTAADSHVLIDSHDYFSPVIPDNKSYIAMTTRMQEWSFSINSNSDSYWLCPLQIGPFIYPRMEPHHINQSFAPLVISICRCPSYLFFKTPHESKVSWWSKPCIGYVYSHNASTSISIGLGDFSNASPHHMHRGGFGANHHPCTQSPSHPPKTKMASFHAKELCS